LVGGVVGAALAAATAGSTDAATVRATMHDGEVTALAPPRGRRRAAIAVADELLVDLTGGGVDLHRLAGRWVDWWQQDGFEADPLLVAALHHLGEFDAPPTALRGGSVAALAAALPAALTRAAPRGMVAGAFHVARMLDPAETTALATVALVVAAAAFLEGRRDFVPDVVAAMRANDAPDDVVDAMRTIPRDPRTPPSIPRGDTPDPVAAASWLLWMAHHRPRGTDALREMALSGGIAPTVGAVAGALFGARDGVGSWPVAWMDGAGDEVVLRRALAKRLGAHD
ncbi:MAG: ADP-ribosylglycohydrolase family protein, partial [Gemmatimonadales bacterium]